MRNQESSESGDKERKRYQREGKRETESGRGKTYRQNENAIEEIEKKRKRKETS